MNRAILMALLIAPLFTAGIAIGGIQNASAGGPVTIVVDADGKVGHSNPRNTAQCDGTRIDVGMSIQAAINAADPGDTIIVCPGDYDEAVNVNESDITIKGIAQPTVDGSNGGSPAFTINANGAVLSGFKALSGDDDCIVINSNDNKVLGNLVEDCDEDGIQVNGNNNRIAGNRAESCLDDGIEVDGDNNIIKGNVVNGSDGDGIDLDLGADNNIVQGNTVTNTIGSDGIEVESDGNIIKGNTVTNSSTQGIDLFSTAENNFIEQNTITENDDGIQIAGDNNIIRRNNANDNTDNGIIVSETAAGNTFTQNTTNENGSLGIKDFSLDGGTAGTANTYDKNKCTNNGSDNDDGSEPDGLCSPQD